MFVVTVHGHHLVELRVWPLVDIVVLTARESLFILISLELPSVTSNRRPSESSLLSSLALERAAGAGPEQAAELYEPEIALAAT